MNIGRFASVALAAMSFGALPALSQTLDAATDPRIDPEVRAFLARIDKDSSPFGELPQPK